MLRTPSASPVLGCLVFYGAGVQKLALQSIINEIRTSTATMTSVPKPLKFLSPHADALKARCEQLPAGSESRMLLADVVSVLSTTVAAKEGVRDALKFRLQVREEAFCVLWGRWVAQRSPWARIMAVSRVPAGVFCMHGQVPGVLKADAAWQPFAAAQAVYSLTNWLWPGA